MHKIAEKEFTIDDFSHEHLSKTSIKVLARTVYTLNFWRGAFNCKNNEERNLYFANSDWNDTYVPTKEDCWWQMIQLLPSSYNQTRNVMLNYEVLANIYKSRKDHKLDEWREFCRWIESLPYSELIIQKDQRGKRRLINVIDQDTMTNASSMNEAVNNWLRDKYPDGCPTAPTECDVQLVKDSMKKEE